MNDKQNTSNSSNTTLLESYTHEMISQIVDQYYPVPEKLLSSEKEYKDRQKSSLEKALDINKIQERFHKGLAILKDHHVECFDPSQNAAREAFANQIRKQLNLDQQASEPAYHTFEEILCIPNTTMKAAYRVGSELFSKKLYQEASDVFFVMTQLNPYYANIWLSMGLCLQNQQLYRSALESYSIAILLGSKNPEPYLYSVECYLELKDKKLAQEMLAFVSPLIESSSREELKQHSVILKNLANKEKV